MSKMASYSRTYQQPIHSCYPENYAQAREQFLAEAQNADCLTTSWPLAEKGPNNGTLAIDVAIWGSSSAAQWLIITSGLHGTEGPFGSAVQCGFLQTLAGTEFKNTSVLFLHALNPFGFAWIRRANENNVDLNRNFLLPGEAYQGAHPLYHHVYRSFDPLRRQRIYENFYLVAGWLITRHSRAALQTSLPVGQYDYPKGLFYGGSGPSQTQLILQNQLRGIMPDARDVTHLDFHTGLGRWAEYRLLTDAAAGHEDVEWFRSWAIPNTVEPSSQARTAYVARGSIGPWMKHVAFPHAHYRYAGAEFGTYGQVRVLNSLVKELRAHYTFEPGHPYCLRAKRMVKETFVPRSPRWRATALQRGVDLCERCLRAIMKS